VDTVPETIVFDRDGTEHMTVETCDISDLPADWEWPEPVQTIAADDETDIYGVIYRPPGFSEEKNYPVLDFSGGYRWYTQVCQGSFGNAASLYEGPYMWAQAYAALGFVVVTLEGRGTPLRSKAFSEHRYGEPSATSDLNDRVAGIKQVAERYPYIDISRVGLAGTEGATNAIFGQIDHPDFYKATAIHCFHDPREELAEMAETFDGVPAYGQEDTGVRHAIDCVSDFKGKLLLVDGLLCYSIGSTFRLVHALQRARKSFDMQILPIGIHAIDGLGVRCEYDFFVTHLLGLTPPEHFTIKYPWDN
jgi:dipeptidyl aminopeptidase/acylaminoacyl peptidase